MARPQAADGGDVLQIYIVVTKSAFMDSGKGMVLQLGACHEMEKQALDLKRSFGMTYE